MENTQNAYKSPLLQFCMKVMTYLRRLGKEKEISMRGQSEKINLKIFENLKKNQNPVINIDQD